MSTTPIDAAALAQARERIEKHAMIYGYRVQDGKHIEVRTVDWRDLRLVLDALAEPRCTAAERAYLDAERAYFNDPKTRFSDEAHATIIQARVQLDRERTAKDSQ